MKIPDSCMAQLFGVSLEYMPDNMLSIGLFTAMLATANVLYNKPRAKRYRWLFLRALINQHRRKEELMIHYNHYYEKAYPYKP